MTSQFITSTQEQDMQMGGITPGGWDGASSRSRLSRWRWLLRFGMVLEFCAGAGLCGQSGDREISFISPTNIPLVLHLGYSSYFQFIRCYFAWNLGRLHRYLAGFVSHRLGLWLLAGLSLIALCLWYFTSPHFPEEAILSRVFTKQNLVFVPVAYVLWRSK